jgi:hypothetical protein
MFVFPVSAGLRADNHCHAAKPATSASAAASNGKVGLCRL